MPIIYNFYIKLVICVALIASGWWVVNNRERFAQQEHNASKIIGLFFLIFRLLPFVGIYLIFGIAPSNDVPFFFYKAKHAVVGDFVYRDFWSYHAPLFSYIIAVPVFFWHNPRAIVLLMILMEGLIVWQGYRAFRNKINYALQAACLYLVLPGGFLLVLLNGQEDLWFWAITCLMWLYARKSTQPEIGMGLWFALGLLTIKVTFIFLLFPMLVWVKRPLRMLLTMAAVGLPAVGFLYWQIGDAFLMPIRHTAVLLTPNAFSVLRPFLELLHPIAEKQYTLANWVGLFFSVSIPTFVAFRYKQNLSQGLPYLFCMVFIGMMIFQPSAPAGYAVTSLLPITFLLIDFQKPKIWWFFVLFNLLLVIQPFLYVYFGLPTYTDFHLFAQPKYLLEYSVQAATVGCYCWLYALAFQKIQQGATTK